MLCLWFWWGACGFGGVLVVLGFPTAFWEAGEVDICLAPSFYPRAL